MVTRDDWAFEIAGASTAPAHTASTKRHLQNGLISMVTLPGRIVARTHGLHEVHGAHRVHLVRPDHFSARPFVSGMKAHMTAARTKAAADMESATRKPWVSASEPTANGATALARRPML